MKNIFKKKYNNKGFTLAELIIVIAIMAIISTLALFNSSKLNSSVLLSDTAYEIGLIVRDAQISGLGAKVLLSGGMATTTNQGVYFNMDKQETVILFADLDKGNAYSDGEDTQVYNIENKRAGKILSMCTIPGDSEGTDICDESNISELNVIFKRPNPEAYFYVSDGVNPSEHQGSVVINIGFVDGECKSIIIYKTGAIQIDKSYCPTNTEN